MFKKLILFALISVLGTVVATAQEKLMSGGKSRNIIVYAPKNLPDNRPLLISMHGMNQDAGYQRSQANYEAVADTAKFVVVYPDGEGRSWDLGGMKDINFILDIIDAMHTRYKINKNRVYLSGFSMGGMMTYYAMTKIADKIAAFAPVSGYNMGGPNTNSSRPVPFIHVHGTGDDVCVYSPVQSHLDAWVKRNKCDATPLVLNPYPVGSKSTATMYRYRNGLNGVEVAHLKLPGKGHWHSNDPAFAMTNVEIWNFCQRFSLVSGPELQKVTPENNSFDMLQDKHNTYTLTFDKPVDCKLVKGVLKKSSTTSIPLTLAESGESTTLTFTVPSSANIDDGNYTLSVSGIESKDGGKGSTVNVSYTYGIEEVGETLKVDTILTQDWYSQRDAIGEGIPKGWVRVNSRSDGTKDEQKSGAANTGGARMKYFEPGGDFDAGFYLSARDYDRADFTYGGTTGMALTLKKGKYIVSFNSIYWNAGAKNDNNTFSLTMLNKKDNSLIYSEPSIKPSGCLNEKSDQKVTGSEHHEIVCDLNVSAQYLLQFSMASGWNGIIIGQPTITTCPSIADTYKGGFLRTLAQAKSMSDKMKNIEGHDSQKEKLSAVIDQYASFSSISPTEYEAATNALLAAMKPLEPVSIGSIALPANNDQLYDLMGRRVTGTPHCGIYIRNGKKIFIR